MTTALVKRRSRRRRGPRIDDAGGLAELGRAARKLRKSPRPIELGPIGVVDAPDEIVLVIITEESALLRKLRVRGRAVDARELRLQLAGAEAAVEEVARGQPAPIAPQLTAAEAALLDDAGMVEQAIDAPSPLERSRIELHLLVRGSLTIDDAARALGVTTSRLRQRLSHSRRTLYGIKQGRGWRIPRFQFEARDRLVRGIDRVLPRVRDDAHPLEVRDWFTLPHQDLVIGGGERVSPKAWLSSGRSPETVAELAAEI
jgi:hypothetical protein